LARCISPQKLTLNESFNFQQSYMADNENVLKYIL